MLLGHKGHLPIYSHCYKFSFSDSSSSYLSRMPSRIEDHNVRDVVRLYKSISREYKIELGDIVGCKATIHELRVTKRIAVVEVGGIT